MSSNIINEHPVCRVCNNADVTFLCSTENEHSYSTELNHYKCNNCGTVFVGNKVESEELGVAYATLNTKDYYKDIEIENKKKMNTAIVHLESSIEKQSEIIDIGTGNGLFVELLNKAGYMNISAHEIKGSDLSKIEKYAKQIYQDFDYSCIPSRKFDAVTMLDVLEHVLDPQFLINSVSRILKEDGIIYFHTPVVTRTDIFMHFLLKLPLINKVAVIWQRGRTSIFHLENYTKKSINILLDQAGFNQVKIILTNELSWPVKRYVEIYLFEKNILSKKLQFLSPLLALMLYPFLASNFFNANKAIVMAKKNTNLPESITVWH